MDTIRGKDEPTKQGSRALVGIADAAAMLENTSTADFPTTRSLDCLGYSDVGHLCRNQTLHQRRVCWTPCPRANRLSEGAQHHGCTTRLALDDGVPTNAEALLKEIRTQVSAADRAPLRAALQNFDFETGKTVARALARTDNIPLEG